MKPLIKEGKKSSEFYALVMVAVLWIVSNFFGAEIGQETVEDIKRALADLTNGGSFNGMVALVIGYFLKRGYLKGERIKAIRDMAIGEMQHKGLPRSYKARGGIIVPSFDDDASPTLLKEGDDEYPEGAAPV